MLLASVCLVASIMGYGWFRADQETRSARNNISMQMAALSQNLAAVNAHFIQTNEPEQVEKLILQTATIDGIYSLLVTDVAGRPMTEVVNKNGTWSPRYNFGTVAIPSLHAPDLLLETHPFNASHRDFLAGRNGTMTAWHRIQGTEQPVGWVRINYRLDTFEIIATNIQHEAVKAVALATAVTLLLLSLLLRPALRALRVATAFASNLDTAMGAQLTVSGQTTEVQALGNALNVVSHRLQTQHSELISQKFALDQHAIVSVTDLAGDIIYANDRFVAISQYPREELLGQNHRILKSGEHPPAVFEDMWHTISQGKVWRGDVKNRKKDGSFYWVSATIVPMLGPDGLPYQYVGIRTDISANKALEQRLESARDEAQAATLAKGQFLANMSHEIRTPMNAVLGMLRLLQNTELNNRQLDYAGKAEGAAQTLLGLLNDILDFSKIEANKMSLELRPFRVDKMMRDISVILSSNLGGKPVELLFDIDPATPVALLGDALRLQQVLINLSSNAVKFTPTGEVVVRIEVQDKSDSAVTLLFAVRDSGIGIAPENQHRIFEGFSQAEASTTRRFGGTGLGLSISRRLVTLMGGELGLQSSLGKGSTFSFSVTLALDPQTHDAPQPHLPDGFRALVVDDNPQAREVIGSMARALGWQVDLADSGAQALTWVQQHAQAGTPYHAIFLDWQMPEMDGWQTIAHLPKRSPESPPDSVAPLLIMITGNSREMLTQRSAEEQAQLHGFLIKPVTTNMLQDAVVEALGKTTPTWAAAAPTPVVPQLPLQGLRLLVVEDNFINQQVAQELLTQEGAQVVLADNGQLGVDAIQQAVADGMGFDAILMDLQMPVMDGFEATRVLRQEPTLAHLPIIAMTANAMTSDRDACLAAGMNAHIGKPFNLAELTALLLQLTRPEHNI